MLASVTTIYSLPHGFCSFLANINVGESSPTLYPFLDEVDTDITNKILNFGIITE